MWIRRFPATLVLALAVYAPATPLAADAQLLPGLPTTPSSSPGAYWGIRQEGLYTTAPVIVDGGVLFRIAVLTNGPRDRMPIDLRANYVQSVLDHLLAATSSGTVYDPRTLTIDIARDGSQIVLQALDARHRRALPILTVTSTDAQYEGMSVDSLASRWQAALQGALRSALLGRQPAVERRSIDLAVAAGLALLGASLVVWFFVSALRRRIDELEERAAARARSLREEQSAASVSHEEAHARRQRFLALAVRVASPEQRLALYRALAATLLWSLLLAWFIGVTWLFSLFPQTMRLSRILYYRGSHIAAIWIVTGLLNRFLDVIIARLPGLWQMSHITTAEDRARRMLRSSTVTRTLAGFKLFILVFLAVLATLARLGVPIASVVTIGGVAALAVSFAAQNLVRDFAGGFLVLVEDQYVVGDYITINGQSGIVEHLTLRMVQLRDEGGNLITIPHSAVTNVVNQSRNWSRVDYRLPIDPSADVAKAMALLRDVIDELAGDEQWRYDILDPLEWIGIQSLSRDAVIVRACVRTAPLRQFELRRQINTKVLEAFTKNGIVYGAPVP